MSGHFPEEVRNYYWLSLKERRDWLRWIVPIAAVLLGLSVSLYKPEISLHHPHPSVLKWAWAALALSIGSGVIGATAVASVQEGLVRDLKAADNVEKAMQLSRRFAAAEIRLPSRLVRICLVLCPILFATGLGLLVLFGIWL